MATTRSTGKISPKWIRQTRKYFLKFLQATQFPLRERQGPRGQTFVYPEWLIMLIGVVDVKCKEPTYLGLHRLTCQFWKELGGRQLSLPPISESPWRERLKKIGYQFGNTPGYVLQIFPPGYFDEGGQRR
jgi:hypothetical protein